MWHHARKQCRDMLKIGCYSLVSERIVLIKPGDGLTMLRCILCVPIGLQNFLWSEFAKSVYSRLTSCDELELKKNVDHHPSKPELNWGELSKPQKQPIRRNFASATSRPARTLKSAHGFALFRISGRSSEPGQLSFLGNLGPEIH
ncbi:hypothetical protein PIB30_042550 [Stylosanthes scabra]|uniref:Uncharacterized protein n=1 Tax=Stylosanthes scabra TaxID=79078 RepID=A0ABU6XD80_9FABA|nr:hypothetical protein [Stylosanthes scabra]